MQFLTIAITRRYRHHNIIRPPSHVLVSAYLTDATITRPEGYKDGVKWSTRIIQEPMNITASLTATLQFQETWGGWQPGNYMVETPDWAFNAPTLKIPDTNTCDGLESFGVATERSARIVSPKNVVPAGCCIDS